MNVPLADLQKDLPSAAAKADVAVPAAAAARPVFVVCRRGVDSLAAVQLLRDSGVPAKNIAGGLQRWAADVDGTFPTY